jgi:hypothetical protein
MQKDVWLDSRVESSNWAVVLCEPFRNFNFRRQPRLIRLPAEPARPGSKRCQGLWRRDPRNDIAWHQADDKAVGVVENDRGVDRQVERRGGRARCSHRTLRYRCLHLRVPSSTRDPHGCITLHRRRRSACSGSSPRTATSVTSMTPMIRSATCSHPRSQRDGSPRADAPLAIARRGGRYCRFTPPPPRGVRRPDRGAGTRRARRPVREAPRPRPRAGSFAAGRTSSAATGPVSARWG